MSDQISHRDWSVQDFLSFGYLYLLLLGIVSDSIYYGIVGVNILSYSDVLDVLLSPIVRLTDNLVFPTIIIIIPGVLYYYMLLIEKLQKRKEKKKADAKPESAFLGGISRMNAWLLFSALVVFSAFIGYGLGGGYALKERMQEERIKVDHRITFQDDDVLEVKLVGNNTDYVFYIPEKGKAVMIAPVKENIRSIEQIK